MTDEMPDILKKICRVKRREIDALHARDRADLTWEAERREPPRGFRKALQASRRVSLIGEIKKASPSEGLIREDFNPSQLARSYHQGGAKALSVLTDRKFFQGDLHYLLEAREATDLPVLRKDFVLDELQLLEARAWGADAVLLIVAALEPERLQTLRETAAELGMDTLVEVHTREELDIALEHEPDLIGINNRNLRTFRVDLHTTERLAPLIPDETATVAESGIETRQDIERLKACGIDAVLVGTSLMRQPNVRLAARRLSEV